MKKLVISLQRRTDRKKEFYKNNLINYEFIKAIDYKRLDDFIVDEEFRDPFKNRPVLKNKGLPKEIKVNIKPIKAVLFFILNLL